MNWQIKRQGRFWLVKKGKSRFLLQTFFYKKLRPFLKENPEVSEFKKVLLALLKEKVLYFLARRDRSQKELERYLKHLHLYQFWPQIKTWLERLGLVDDRRFSFALVDYYLRRLYGPLYIGQQLRRRGVSRELIERVLPKVYTKEKEKEVAKKLIEKYKRYHQLEGIKQKAKLVRYLSSRGFASDIIYELIDNL